MTVGKIQEATSKPRKSGRPDITNVLTKLQNHGFEVNLMISRYLKHILLKCGDGNAAIFGT